MDKERNGRGSSLSRAACTPFLTRSKFHDLLATLLRREENSSASSRQNLSSITKKKSCSPKPWFTGLDANSQTVNRISPIVGGGKKINYVEVTAKFSGD